jgi:CBS domain-containing membrane protein
MTGKGVKSDSKKEGTGPCGTVYEATAVVVNDGDIYDPEIGDTNVDSESRKKSYFELTSSKDDEEKKERDPVKNSDKVTQAKKEEEVISESIGFLGILQHYFHKFAGVEGKKSPPMTKPLEIPVSSILAFVGLFLVTITDYFYLTKNFYANHDDKFPISMLTGAFAATSVLIYEAYQSPLAQPRNVFGSYCVCSFAGVSVRLICDIIGIPRYVTAPMAAAFGILGMNLTKTVHPPGGAVAIIAVIGGNTVEGIGYGYCLTAMGGAIIMVAWACVGNNLIPTRQYPLYWY